MKTFIPLILLILLTRSLSLASLYPSSYLESRKAFRSFSENPQQSNIKPPELITQRIPTRHGIDLAIDALYFAQTSPTKNRLLIITGGIHGVEAFTGSALQFSFLESGITPELLENTGILLVHAVNPYGYHFKRRVDEYNVDLNRNISASRELFQKQSPAYDNFNSFLNPTEKLNASLWSDLKLFVSSIVKLIKQGRKQLAQIILEGQYQTPKGIYFGGKKISANSKIIKEIFLTIGKGYSKILHIDLHTGYGERGTLHLLSSHEVAKTQGFSEIFKGYSIDLGSDDNFYATTGSFDYFTLQTFKNKDFVIPMTFEFGTMDSQTIFGGFLSLRNMIYENQAHHNGAVDKSTKKKSRKAFLEMFNPSDQEWRNKVMKDGLEALKTVSIRFSNI